MMPPRILEAQVEEGIQVFREEADVGEEVYPSGGVHVQKTDEEFFERREIQVPFAPEAMTEELADILRGADPEDLQPFQSPVGDVPTDLFPMEHGVQVAEEF